MNIRKMELFTPISFAYIYDINTHLYSVDICCWFPGEMKKKNHLHRKNFHAQTPDPTPSDLFSHFFDFFFRSCVFFAKTLDNGQ